ncbi:quaternary amine ABC transporter ATP-binding protein [Salinicola peritrichatus]|uniref:quaternary amine ABC transporter ATP-binding protein n=1 Tax=Salinicola peritrichatus TaxID=1267424 RepID=UPI000DA193A7|nr:glycine betaine/L-proline ABC transporter ATP-binding protein [Salinicola peritrichatus]
MTTIKIEIKGLNKVYGERPEEALKLARQGCHPRDILSRTGQMLAVSEVSLKVREGEIFTIMGLSGSGKSTLVRCLNRLIEPTNGSILLDGEDICLKSSQELRDIRRTKIAMVFQNFALLPHKSILENVEFGLKLRGEVKESRREKAGMALERVGLSNWSDRYPDNLSGGMKQRVGLARALANDPDILLMDEPFSALDPLIRADLQAELIKLQCDIKKTIIFITHDFHEAVKLSDQVAVMRDGKFVQMGTPEEIILHPGNEYVENFSREMDRSKVITAKDVAQTGATPLYADMAADSVLKRMKKTGKQFAILVDSDKKPLGYIFRGDLENSTELEMKVGADFQRQDEEVISVSSSTIVGNLYFQLSQQLPLAISDDKGHVVGTMDANDVMTHLSQAGQYTNIRNSAHAFSTDGQISGESHLTINCFDKVVSS